MRMKGAEPHVKLSNAGALTLDPFLIAVKLSP
jgi:hypothetical protein